MGAALVDLNQIEFRNSKTLTPMLNNFAYLKRRGTSNACTVGQFIELLKHTYICSIQRNKNHSWLGYIYKTKLCDYKIESTQWIPSSTVQNEKGFTFQTVITSKICSRRHVTPWKHSSNAWVPRQKTRESRDSYNLLINCLHPRARAPLRGTVSFFQYYVPRGLRNHPLPTTQTFSQTRTASCHPNRAVHSPTRCFARLAPPTTPRSSSTCCAAL